MVRIDGRKFRDLRERDLAMSQAELAQHTRAKRKASLSIQRISVIENSPVATLRHSTLRVLAGLKRISVSNLIALIGSDESDACAQSLARMARQKPPVDLYGLLNKMDRPAIAALHAALGEFLREPLISSADESALPAVIETALPGSRKKSSERRAKPQPRRPKRDGRGGAGIGR